MLKEIREKLAEMFEGTPTEPPLTTENSPLHEIQAQYPNGYEFLERKYGLKPSAEDKALTLKEFAETYGLPPPQILFAEIQMDSKLNGVKEVTASQAREWIENEKKLVILDVREDWEIEICSLPNYQKLTAELLDKTLGEMEKNAPILVYCHFGVRSMDAAMFLADRGFTNVASLRGGIDAWASQIDPSMKRYQNAYC